MGGALTDHVKSSAFREQRSEDPGAPCSEWLGAEPVMTVRLPWLAALASMFMMSAVDPAWPQVVHARGQNVVPVYEGWERNRDGTFTLVFGYFNRNLEERPIIPVGADNKFEPGDPDRGQPTHFYPRRQQFMFTVPVPADWGARELVWTLTSHGRTEQAVGSLLPVWEITEQAYEQNRSSPLLRHIDDPVNQRPVVVLRGSPQASATPSATLALTVSVTDDGLPVARPRPRPRSSSSVARQPESPMDQAVVSIDPAWRLGVIWVHHRGPGPVTFTPQRQAITDGRAGDATAQVGFTTPGTYVLRAYADDGILTSYVDATVTVTLATQRLPPR